MSEEVLRWARQIQSIAQAGLTYGKDAYDLERYQQLMTLAAEMLAVVGTQSAEEFRTLLGQESGYATPKVDVRGVIFREGRILLVHERAEDAWSLPGGWADLGESPADIAVREVREEAGLVVRPVKLLAVLDKLRHPHPPALHHIYKIFIRCEVVQEGELADNPETDQIGYFVEDRLPPLSLDRVTPSQIAMLFAHLRDADRPTDFD